MSFFYFTIKNFSTWIRLSSATEKRKETDKPFFGLCYVLSNFYSFSITQLSKLFICMPMLSFFFGQRLLCVYKHIKLLGFWSVVLKYFTAYFSSQHQRRIGYMCFVLLCSANTLRFPWQKLLLRFFWALHNEINS